MRKKVMNRVNYIVNQQILDNNKEIGIDAFSLSLDFNSDRSNISRILNDLWKNGELIKVDGRPVLFIPTKILQEHFNNANFSIYYKNSQSFINKINDHKKNSEYNQNSVYNYDLNYAYLEKLLRFNKQNINYSVPIQIIINNKSNIYNLIEQAYYNLLDPAEKHNFKYISTEEEFLSIYNKLSGSSVVTNINFHFIAIHNIELWSNLSKEYLKDFFHKISFSPHIFNKNNIQYFLFSKDDIDFGIHKLELYDFESMNFSQRIESITSLLLEISLYLNCSIELSKENINILVTATYSHTYLEIYSIVFSEVLNRKLDNYESDHITILSTLNFNLDSTYTTSIEILSYLGPDLFIVNSNGYINYEQYLENVKSIDFPALTIEKYVTSKSTSNLSLFVLNFFYAYSQLHSEHLDSFTKEINIEFSKQSLTKLEVFINSLSNYKSINHLTKSLIKSKEIYKLTNNQNKFLIILLLKENSINKYYEELLIEHNIDYNLLEFIDNNEYRAQLIKLKNLQSIKNSIIFVNEDTMKLLSNDVTFEMNFFPITFELLNKMCKHIKANDYDKTLNLLLTYQMTHDKTIAYQLEENSLEYRYLEAEVKFLDLRKAFPIISNIYVDVCNRLKIVHKYELKVKFIIQATLMIERCIQNQALVINKIETILENYKINNEFILLRDALNPLTKNFNFEVPPSEVLLLLSMFNLNVIV